MPPFTFSYLFIFIVAAEIMSIAIKDNNNISGIQGTGKEDYTISQFADDTSIAITNGPNNMMEVFKMLEQSAGSQD